MVDGKDKKLTLRQDEPIPHNQFAFFEMSYLNKVKEVSQTMESFYTNCQLETHLNFHPS